MNLVEMHDGVCCVPNIINNNSEIGPEKEKEVERVRGGGDFKVEKMYKRLNYNGSFHSFLLA